MFWRVLKMLFWVFIFIIILGACILIIPRLITVQQTQSQIMHTISEASYKPVAIVFGAGLWRDGRPTPVLRDRVSTAANLYFEGKVERLLMSGDNRFEHYNEPAAMQEYAISLGVPKEVIVLDYAGRSTYDTCYRAKEIFRVTQAILVTQRFHLPRAIFLCNQFGIESIGVIADQRIYRKSSLTYWNLREIPATLTAWWDIYIAKPVPVLGEPEPIFPEET